MCLEYRLYRSTIQAQQMRPLSAQAPHSCRQHLSTHHQLHVFLSPVAGEEIPTSVDAQTPKRIADVEVARVAVQYTDELPSFPDAVSTRLRFSGGTTAVRAEQLRGTKRCKVQTCTVACFSQHTFLPLCAHVSRLRSKVVCGPHLLQTFGVGMSSQCQVSTSIRSRQKVVVWIVQVDMKNAEFRDDSMHELNPPQIRGVVPRLAHRISAQQVR